MLLLIYRPGTFSISDTTLYVPVVTLSTQDNAQLLQRLKSGFKRVISWSKYLSKPQSLRQNANLNHLVEPSFQRINRLFHLAFKNDTQRTSHSRHFLPNVWLNKYNVTIDGKNFFDQPIKDNKVVYENIRKVVTCQGDD